MESSSSTAGIAGLLAVILANAIVSAMLSSLINARKQNLRELADEGSQRARRVLALSEDSTVLLSSRQFVNILAHFLAATIITLTIAQPLVGILAERNVSLGTAQLIIYPAAWLIGATIMLLFGELIPVALVASNPERLAMALVSPTAALLRLLAPIASLMLWVSNRLASSVGGRANTPYVTEEEIKTLVDAGQEEGVIEDDEKAMIYSIFQFSDKVVRELMVPRIDMVALEADTTIQNALDTIITEGHSRIPIYEESIDKIVGLLYAKDLLKLWREGGPESSQRPVREAMRPAYFVPESKRAGALLEELQTRKIHMAIVIDEYGGTAGLVTIEDLVEEIVGEIQDEYDPDEEAEYQAITDSEYLFDGGIDLDDVNELMDVDLSTEESDTLGGYVFTALGRVPLAGERFESEGLEITVESIIGRRIRKVRVKKLPPAVEGQHEPSAPQESEEAQAAVDSANANPGAGQNPKPGGSVASEQQVNSATVS